MTFSNIYIDQMTLFSLRYLSLPTLILAIRLSWALSIFLISQFLRALPDPVTFLPAGIAISRSLAGFLSTTIVTAVVLTATVALTAGIVLTIVGRGSCAIVD